MGWRLRCLGRLGDSPEVDDLMVEGEELFGDVAQTVYDNIREVLEQECE